MDIFKSILTTEQIITNREITETHGTDRTGTYKGKTTCVLFPNNRNEVAAILKLCNENQICVITEGGRTGLAGGTVAIKGEVVLSLSKMNKIETVDGIGGTIEVEAGAVLENIQQKVDEAGLYFPLDFAAKGSCMIGGCISTNAGGVKVLKYGMTRELVMGLEIVLADGNILDLNRSLVKDNSGYDLKQCFIGAEGTLGIITKATLKCVQKPKNLLCALLTFQSFKQVPKALTVLKKSFDVTAYEYLDAYSIEAMISAMPQASFPFDENTKHVVLVEIDENSTELFEETLLSFHEKGFVEDATIAESSEQFKSFWNIREAISDSLYLKGDVHANDISVPIANLSTFLNDLEQLFDNDYKQFNIGVFGHIGDGNLHIYVIDTETLNTEKRADELYVLDEKMFRLVQKYDGSISAEHGIGLLKKKALHFRRSELEIELMRKIKNIFDPKHILNPGKIFD